MAGCSAIKNIEVTAVDLVGIEDIISEERKLIIIPQVDDEFEYSINGNNFQDSNEFDVSGGIYTVYTRDKANCKTVSQEFPNLVFPKFVTPNGDGYNDVFRIKGLGFFNKSKINIYDRYGKLLKSGNGRNFSWDGKLNGRELPATDYWYEIEIENFALRKGHFSLIR